jgi:hypothetical protein
MKKNLFSGFMVMFIVALIFFSCKKNDVITPHDIIEDTKTKQNEATWVYDHDSKGWLMRLLFLCGHDISLCGGACMKILGEYGHIDCRGFGDACANSVRARIEIDENDNYFLVILDLDVWGDDLEYLFPDRSFYITNPQDNTELWLNVNEQILLREATDLPFIIEEVWFSEEPEL